MGDVTLMQSHDNSPVFSEAVYAPEALLTEWTSGGFRLHDIEFAFLPYDSP